MFEQDCFLNYFLWSWQTSSCDQADNARYPSIGTDTCFMQLILNFWDLLQVMAGKVGGRKLASPADLNVRPMMEVVRGAVFNILQVGFTYIFLWSCCYAMDYTSDEVKRCICELDFIFVFQALGGCSSQLPPGRWLDLYSGTGSVGIEALSRGCEAV